MPGLGVSVFNSVNKRTHESFQNLSPPSSSQPLLARSSRHARSHVLAHTIMLALRGVKALLTARTAVRRTLFPESRAFHANNTPNEPILSAIFGDNSFNRAKEEKVRLSPQW